MGLCRLFHTLSASAGQWPGLLALGLILTLPAQAQAPEAQDGHQDLGQLRASVGDFLREHYDQPEVSRLEVKVGRLDQRLRLSRCEQPLSMSVKDPDLAGGGLTVHTRCPGPKPWALYVPADVAVFRPVAIASRSLGRGHRVSEGDIDIELRNTGRLRQGFVAGADGLIDLELRRPLKQGEAFRMGILIEPTVVNRGDQVRLRARTGNISVDTQGTALGSGRVGDQVRVRNDRSERIVRGKVVAPGTVEIVL